MVYDTERQHIHHLSPLVSAVWRACMSPQSMESLVHAVDAEMGMRPSHLGIRLALTKLADAQLLDAPLSAHLRVAAPSRRAFMKKAALAGAGATIVSLTVPMAAGAVSCGQACAKNGDCTTPACPTCKAKTCTA
jgi:hypothetical protein